MTQWLRRNAEAQAHLFVVNASTPAQLFHVLRRQMNRPFTKPLVLISPKFLLHHRRATSALEVRLMSGVRGAYRRVCCTTRSELCLNALFHLCMPRVVPLR